MPLSDFEELQALAPPPYRVRPLRTLRESGEVEPPPHLRELFDRQLMELLQRMPPERLRSLDRPVRDPPFWEPQEPPPDDRLLEYLYKNIILSAPPTS